MAPQSQMLPPKRPRRTSCASISRGILDAEWFVHEMAPMMASEEAICMVLVAIECDLQTLWRVLPREAESIRALSTPQFVYFAAERGWWKYAALVQQEYRPTRRKTGAQTLVMSDIDREFASKDPIFALWRSIQHRYPLKLPASVMYAAAKRGELGELVWLDKWCEYDAAEALQCAASHLDIVHWLLCRPDTPFERIITVQFGDYPFRAISWSGGYIISYCVVADVGWLPPRIGVDGTYPLIDWAAEVGNLELLKKLHTHPTEKALCTSSALENAAIRGDVAMLQWLFENRFLDFYGVPIVLKAAASHGHLHILEWLCNKQQGVPSAAGMIEEAVQHGHYETVLWLFHRFGDEHQVKVHLMDKAVKSGSIQVVRYLHDLKGCRIDVGSVWAAAHAGHFQLVQWFYDHGPDLSWPTITEHTTNAAAGSGNLELVKWCVETLDGWSVDALDSALVRTPCDLSVAEYLYLKCQEQVTLLGLSMEDVTHWPNRRSLLRILHRSSDMKMGVWVLEHFPEVDCAPEDVAFDVRMVTNLRKSPGWWDFVRALLHHRHSFARLIRHLPRWVAMYGILADFEKLEAINHAELFTKATLESILKHSRDENVLLWFLTKHHKFTWLDMRLVSWAAKYGTPKLLSWLKKAMFETSQQILEGATEKNVREFLNVIVWSAVRHEQVSVLDWVNTLDFPIAVMESVWQSRVSIQGAKCGRWRSLLWFGENIKIDKSQYNELARITVRHGHVQYLRRASHIWKLECVLDDVLQAARRGHIGSVEYVLQRQPDLLDGHEMEAREINSLRRRLRSFVDHGILASA